MKILDLSNKKTLNKGTYWTDEVNQLYHPTGNFPQDSYDIVYSKDLLQKTKFSPIVLKEWLFLVKKDGYLVIDYIPNELIDFKKLEDLMWWLWKKQYRVLFHGEVSSRDKLSSDVPNFIQHHEEYYKKNLDQKTLLPNPLQTIRSLTKKGSRIRFLCKKLHSTLLKHDSIDKWTFGIITNGMREDWLEEIIASIVRQKIPDYEIIICGRYRKRPEKHIVYIPFNERDDLGWISKKKNMIIEQASYENVCMIHDRVFFEKDWYKNMRKWGNCFEHLACAQYYQGQRTNDWLLHEKLEGIEYSFSSHLDFKDWDINACQGGQFHIVKKTLAKKIPWNEGFLWGRPEDVALTNDLRDAGHIIRCNPNSKIGTLVYKFGSLPRVAYDNQKLSSKRIGNTKRIIARKIYSIIHGNKIVQQTILNMTEKLTKKSFIQ